MKKLSTFLAVALCFAVFFGSYVIVFKAIKGGFAAYNLVSCVSEFTVPFLSVAGSLSFATILSVIVAERLANKINH